MIESECRCPIQPGGTLIHSPWCEWVEWKKNKARTQEVKDDIFNITEGAAISGPYMEPIFLPGRQYRLLEIHSKDDWAQSMHIGSFQPQPGDVFTYIGPRPPSMLMPPNVMGPGYWTQGFYEFQPHQRGPNLRSFPVVFATGARWAGPL